jgi:hypothetical protein
VVFIQLAAQLQFQGIQFADQLLVHLLHQSLITGEPLGVQIPHFLNQLLQLCLRLRTILHGTSNLVEDAQRLVNLALRVGRVGGLLGIAGPARAIPIIAGVNIAEGYTALTTAATLGVIYLTGAAIADLALSVLALPVLPALTASLTLACLTLTLALSLTLALTLALFTLALTLSLSLALFTLTLSLLARSLLALALLTLALLTLAPLTVGVRPQPGHLIPQPGDIVHGAAELRVLGAGLSTAQCAGSVFDPLA